LIAGVIGHHQTESGRRVERDAETLDRQLPPVVREWMQHHGRVLPGLHHLVQVADRALAHRPSQGTVHPHRLIALQQIPTDQVCGGQVVMAGDGDQRPAEIVGHRLDETGLATTRRPLQD